MIDWRPDKSRRPPSFLVYDCTLGQYALVNKLIQRQLPTPVEKVRASGATSLRAIASELTARGVKTARGCNWSAEQFRAILAR